MTPKEKAKELYENYWIYFCKEPSVYAIFKHAKKCAQIAVDEILNKDGYNNDYWHEVKQEIEKI